jgi:hypothetical protein
MSLENPFKNSPLEKPPTPEKPELERRAVEQPEAGLESLADKNRQRLLEILKSDAKAEIWFRRISEKGQQPYRLDGEVSLEGLEKGDNAVRELYGGNWTELADMEILDKPPKFETPEITPSKPPRGLTEEERRLIHPPPGPKSLKAQALPPWEKRG